MNVLETLKSLEVVEVLRQVIRYKLKLGALPYPFEDFYAKTPGCPHVTIISEANRQPDDEETEEAEGWVTVFVEGDTVTEERAKQELAKINNVSPDAIIIEQED